MMKSIALLSLCFATGVQLSAYEPSCPEVSAMAKMAKAKSFLDLTSARAAAGNSYRANIVFAFRSFELNPKGRSAAEAILELIPHNQEQDIVWHTFGDSLCDTESDRDMITLSSLGDRLPRNLARAVLTVSEKMLDYISYAILSVQDPHSDYAVQMQAVCLKSKPSFLKAVDLLPAREKTWFVTKVFDPNRCRALALPEAE